MDWEQISEDTGYLSGELNDALGTAQALESDTEGDERFVKLREMVEAALDYCNDLYNTLD